MVQKTKIKLNIMKTKTNNQKITSLTIVLLLFLSFTKISAQDFGSDPETCKMNISLFHESVKAKNYTEAYKPWKWVYDNCPKSTKHIYSDGLKIALDQLKNGDTNAEALVNDIYGKRVEFYPSNLGKVYSDWAKFLIKMGASDDIIFEKLNLAFRADPAGMSVKNIFRFFENTVDNYKDTDTQKVFNTYDDVLEAVDKKIGTMTGEYTLLQKKIEDGESLTKSEQWRVDHEFFEKNLNGLGKIQGGLDGMVESIATCDRLIPLYKKVYNENKSNIVWLKRTASRLNRKGCKNDPFYVSLIENWAQADPSVDVLKYLESVYRGQGRTSDADALASRIFDMATPQEKARFYYSQAQDLFGAGKYGEARTKARESLTHNPSYGRAFILIGRMYAKSANNCGSNEFEKRMTYVAAAAKIRQAIKVDPSMASTGKRFLSNYRGNYPSKTLLFNLGKTSGASHRVGCWIGESVRIP
jgi:tetratricopeptide (TPR) repeat protein